MKKIALIACLVFILAIALTVVVSSASEKASPASTVASSPSKGFAIVDGSYDEWNLTDDFFCDMHRAWKVNKPVESKLYLRYSCPSQTLYALVICEPGVTINPVADENWIKESGIKLVDGTSANNGTPPDFQYISNQEGQVIGWEASMQLYPGTYNGFVVHAEVYSDGNSQTSGTPNKEISIRIICENE